MVTDNCREIAFQVIKTQGASIGVTHGNKEVPFEIKRVYFLFDIDQDSVRGGHAHKQLKQVLTAVSGSFEVTVTDRSSCKKTFYMNSPTKGIYIPNMHWRTISGFSKNAVCLCIASERYLETDYIRNYKEFIESEYKR